jgi:hypothetical protein
MQFEHENQEVTDLEQSRVSKGIAAGCIFAIPLWSVMIVVVGSPSFQKAALYLLCLTVAAGAIWIVKAASAGTATSEQVSTSVWLS